MNISTKSWHWRINCEYFKTLSDSPAKHYLDDQSYVLSNYFGSTLCSYFWGTLFRTCLIIFSLLLVFAGSAIVGYFGIIGPLYTAIAQYQVGYFELEVEYILWIAALTITTLAGIAYLICLFDKNSDKLIPEYIKARKNKFCPILTVRK